MSLIKKLIIAYKTMRLMRKIKKDIKDYFNNPMSEEEKLDKLNELIYKANKEIIWDFKPRHVILHGRLEM